MSDSFQPLPRKVLLEALPHRETVRESGVILPPSTKKGDQGQWSRVVAKGRQAASSDGLTVDMSSLSPGTAVLHNPFVGRKLQWQDRLLFILDIEDVLAIWLGEY